MNLSEEETLHGHFERHAALRPQSIAIETVTETISYGELNRRANMVAAHLQGMGLGKADICVVRCESIIHRVVGVLGILKSNAAFVILEDELPGSRIAEIVKLSQPAGVIAQKKQWADAFNNIQVRLIADSIEDSALARDYIPVTKVGLHDLAFLIFTSGSTGVPKGILCPHKQALARLTWRNKRFNISNIDRCILKSKTSVNEIFGPLISGATIVAIPRERQGDIPYLAKFIDERKITVMNAVPSLLEGLTSLPKINDSSSLKHVFSAGEVLSMDLARRFIERFGSNLHNFYGQRETSYVLAWSWGDPLGSDPERAPVGWPTYLDIYLLDERGKPVSIGKTGELYVAGPISLGYLWADVVDLDRFRDNPFEFNGTSDVIFRTGDILRLCESGCYEFIGRRDNQIKIRGHRVEIEEVEHVIRKHPLVRNCGVCAFRTRGVHALTAYFTSDADIPTSDLQRFARNKMPEYMVPSRFSRLPALPLTTTGKVDRSALRQAHRAKAASTSPVSLPEHKHLFDIWCELFEAECIDEESNFFELGGDSLTATMLVVALEERGLGRWSLDIVYDNPRLGDLAERLESPGASQPLDRIPQRAIGRTSGPLNMLQRRIWEVASLASSQSLLTHPSASLVLHRDIGPERIRAILLALGLRHEALNTKIHNDGSNVAQCLEPGDNLNMECFDLRGEADGAARFVAERLRKRVPLLPLNALVGPSWMAILVRYGDGSASLDITIHHLIADGRSMDLLAYEFAVLYAEVCGGPVAQLGDVSVQPLDHAVWQHDQQDVGAMGRQADYWKEVLRECQFMPALITQISEFKTSTHTLDLGKGAAEGLRSLAREVGATPFLCLMSLFALVLSGKLKREEWCFSTVLPNRRRPELQYTVSMLAEAVFLPFKVGADTSLKILARRLGKQISRAGENLDLSIGEVIARAEGDPPNLLDRPIVSFNMGAQPVRLDREVERWVSVHEPVEPNSTGALLHMYPLSVRATLADDNVRFQAHARADFLSGTEMDEMLSDCDRVLSANGNGIMTPNLSLNDVHAIAATLAQS